MIFQDSLIIFNFELVLFRLIGGTCELYARSFIAPQKLLQTEPETHPDHLSSNGDEGAQIENLSKSGDINAAYRTLADENLRTKYILEGVGLLGDVETAPVDQDFLMEMMEINELVEELQFEPDKENYKSILQTIDSKQSDLDSLMKEKVV
ncbi:MAG: hypothetical protein IPJ13_17115 [Saprospiraceae bacterium]|nr:hypothetical protein [Saprospiraceae bacterium]